MALSGVDGLSTVINSYQQRNTHTTKERDSNFPPGIPDRLSRSSHRLKSGQHSLHFSMPKPRQPSPAAIAQAKQQISHVPGAAVALMGRGFDGSVESAEEVSALALTLEAKPALTQQEIEHRLSTQMITLDAMFYELVVRANGTAQLKPKVALVDLALKVQHSSRKAGLALNTIRNPRQPAQFVKTYIDKQMNQLTAPLPQTETSIPLPESDRPNVEILDTRATSSATREDSAVATVATVHRGTDRAWAEDVQQELL